MIPVIFTLGTTGGDPAGAVVVGEPMTRGTVTGIDVGSTPGTVTGGSEVREGTETAGDATDVDPASEGSAPGTLDSTSGDA
jgi:hypothetical protein